MRRKVIYLALLLMVMMQATAQQVVQNKQRHFKKAVPAGNYSGVTWLGGDRYAVCNDKSVGDGGLPSDDHPHRLHHRQDRGREGRQFYDLKPAEP